MDLLFARKYGFERILFDLERGFKLVGSGDIAKKLMKVTKNVTIFFCFGQSLTKT
ncbi:MAG TPA: hypothetical protein PKY82_04580 [Pyrinomonadaceae bacterium]|nr:hypothetical protein [Pyrinomonadaceae bacterium]